MINDVCGLLESLQSVCVYFSKITIFNPSHMPWSRKSIFLFSFNHLQSFLLKYYQNYSYNFIKLILIYFFYKLKENKNNIIFVNRKDFFFKRLHLYYHMHIAGFDRNDWNNLIDNKAETTLTNVS